MIKTRVIYVIAFITMVLFTGCDEDESSFLVAPIEGKYVMITKYVGSSWTVRIPSRINNMPVIRIGSEAFVDKQLTSVTIPNRDIYKNCRV